MVTLPPGPRTPAPLQTARFARAPTAFLEDCHARFGDSFTLRVWGFGWGRVVVFSRPEHIRKIFTAPPDSTEVGTSNRMLRPFLGDGSLLLMDGPRHRRERKLLMPAFHGDRMRAYADIIRNVTDEAIDELRLDTELFFHDVTQRITLDVIMRAIFGIENAQRLHALRLLLHESARLGSKPRLMIPLFQRDWGRLTAWGRFVRARASADAIVMEQIARYRARPEPGRADILSMLVAARDENGEPMSDLELRDEMRTLLTTGHETTASTLAWTLGWILTNPTVRERIEDEVGRVAGDSPIGGEHVKELEYLDATLCESMRIAPITPAIGRALAAPLTIGGFDLPAGTVVSPAMHLTHRLPDLYPDPDRFDPERFLHEKPDPFAFYPFGGGSRRCIGGAFAMYEMKLVLARLIQRTTIEATPSTSLTPRRRGITLTPTGGMPIIVRQRRALPN